MSFFFSFISPVNKVTCNLVISAWANTVSITSSLIPVFILSPLSLVTMEITASHNQIFLWLLTNQLSEANFLFFDSGLKPFSQGKIRYSHNSVPPLSQSSGRWYLAPCFTPSWLSNSSTECLNFFQIQTVQILTVPWLSQFHVLMFSSNWSLHLHAES